jgi:hypothetical protein
LPHDRIAENTLRIAKLTLACLIALATLRSTVACSSRTDTRTEDAGSSGCEPYTSTADLSQTVSFRNDVVPMFHANCAGGKACHRGAGNATPKSLALGDVDGGLPASAIFQGLVGTKAAEDPDMDLITPGDPGSSYLMHKIDGDQCTLAAHCNAGELGTKYPNCGGPMPPVPPPNTAPRLPTATRDIVRAWIHQGAQNN